MRLLPGFVGAVGLIVAAGGVARADTVVGGDGPDVLVANDGFSVMRGLGGADNLAGDPGDSLVPFLAGLVSTNRLGTPARASVDVDWRIKASRPRLSADGAFAFFVSNADNLVSGVGTGTKDDFRIYRKNIATGAVDWLGEPMLAEGATSKVTHLALSTDGTRIVFSDDLHGLYSRELASTAFELIGNQPLRDVEYSPVEAAVVGVAAGDAGSGGTPVTFIGEVKDVWGSGPQGVETISLKANGDLPSGYFLNPSYSPDGKLVALFGVDTDIDDGPVSSFADLFVKNRETGAVTRIPTSLGGADAGGGVGAVECHISFSSDGKRIAFTREYPTPPARAAARAIATTSPLVVSSPTARKRDETTGFSEVFVRDLATGTETLVSTGILGAASNGNSACPFFVPGTNFVAFSSNATNLGVLPPGSGLFIRNLDTGITWEFAKFPAAEVTTETIHRNFGLTPTGLGWISSEFVKRDPPLDDPSQTYAIQLKPVVGGPDQFTGGPGDDVLFGGKGPDTALYPATTRRQVTDVKTNPDGSKTVVTTGPEGSDTLRGVEIVKFSGESYAVSKYPWPNKVPLYLGPTTPTALNEDDTVTLSDLARDPDGDAVTLAVVRQGTKGSATIRADGNSLTYRPDADANGADSVDLRLSDGVGETVVTIAFDIQPVEDPASDLAIGAPITLPENTANRIFVASVTVTDVDGFKGSLAIDDGRFTASLNGIYLKSGQTIDRETESRIAVTVTLVDGVTITRSVSIPVGDVDEFDVTAPRDGDGTANTVRGIAPAGTRVGITPRAVDRDATDNRVTYGVARTSDFKIKDGRVVTARTLSPVGGLSRSFDVIATSSDGSTARKTFTVVIDPAGKVLPGTLGPDSYSGSAWNDTISGAGDNDILRGLGGEDTLNGQAGDDLLIGGLGKDVLAGGTGIDTASYADKTVPVVIDLPEPPDATTALVDGVSEDTLTGVENLIGGSSGDRLYGNALPNSLAGRDGADELRGGEGDDTLDGGDGPDQLFGGRGKDILIPGAGNDKIDGSRARGSDSPVVPPETVKNIFDEADYRTSSARIDLVAKTGIIRELDPLPSTTLRSTDRIAFAKASTTAASLPTIEIVRGSRFGDRLDGRGVNRFRMDGGPGDDEIIGDGKIVAGKQTFKQRVLYDHAGNAVSIVLDTVRGNGTVVGTAVRRDTRPDTVGKDTLKGILMVTGSLFDDVIVGSEDDNVINGEKGADRLTGAGGFDEFYLASPAESPAGAGDVITDFVLGPRAGQTDFVNVCPFGITAWLGTKPFTGRGNEARYKIGADKASVVLQFDVGGRAGPEAEVTLLKLTSFSDVGLRYKKSDCS